MKMRKAISMCALASLALAYVGTAQANTITGRLWHVPEVTSQNAIPGNVPPSPPDVTFDVNSPLNFSATDATVGAWLATAGAFNVVDNTGGATLSSQMDDGITGTIVEFAGFVTVITGQVFNVAHDDGLTLIIGNLDLAFDPGPTAPTTTPVTYSGPSGTFPFQLVYGECCGGPAVLQVDLPFFNREGNPIPTIPTLSQWGTLLMVVLLVGIAYMTLGRRRNVPAS